MSDETGVRLGPGVYRVNTIQDPLADSAYNIYTQSTTSDATLYLTLVNSNNTPASKETVYTNYGLTYNPLIGNLSIGSSIQISPDRLIYTPTSFYIGNGSTVGITSFSGNIRLGGNSILSSSGDTVVSFADTNTEFKGNVTVLGNFNTNNIIAGIVTATRFIGDGSQLTGIVAGSSYAASAGIATYATTAGISTVAQGLTGTPNLIVGIVTATRFIGDGSQLTGINGETGIATYAASAGIATYANVSGIATYAASAGIASYASSAGIATYANVSGIATYAASAGIATFADYASSAGIATQITSAITGSGLTLATNRLVGRSTAATGAPEEIALSGALSFVSTTLAFSDVIKLVVSNKGETATVATNYVETTVQRACTVIGAFWELAPSATGSSSSQAMLYARRSGTKTSLLSANASLASSAILTDATSLLTGSQALAAGDTVGVDLVAIGTGSSGHIFTVIVRYS
jgi:hypothetical protein